MKSINNFFLIDKSSSNHFLAGYNPEWVFSATAEGAILRINSKEYKIYGNILDEFNNILKEFHFKNGSQSVLAVGYLSYDLGNLIIDERSFLRRPSEFPLIYFCGYRNYFKIKKPLIYNWLQKKCINYFNFYPSHFELLSTMPFNTYKNKIKMIKNYITAGDVYQINFTYRQVYSFTVNPIQFYLKLSSIARPAQGMYLDAGNFQILSASPERFFRINKSLIETFPIKGTIERGLDKREDKIKRQKLQKSSKDRAEHLMIVDLLRNDLGRICKTGSVKVDGLFSVKSYRTVHHMVSKIYGTLEKNINFADIIRTIFPGGSITGAPKIRAVQIIDELENYRRGIYTGSIGYILPDGSADFNIAIRTLIVKGEVAYYSVGGGIVYDSDPLKEYEETITKSRIIEKVIEESKNEQNMLSERKMAF